MSKVKKTLKDLKQIDGKSEKPKKITAHTLEQIWGEDSGLVKYKTFDLDEYKTQLNEMTAADMREHASKLGVMPIDNIERLKNRLVTEFIKHVSSFNRPEPIGVAASKNVSKKVLDILAEAK
jgi:hypothetical protein